MYRLKSLITGAGIGAGLMYLFDPDRGNRRRSLVRDQFKHTFAKTGDGADATLRDVQNRIYGTLAEVRGMFRSDDAPEEVLVSRVRSKMGRYVTHASSIEVAAHDGIVTLSGPVLAHEVEGLLAAVNSVRGVRGINNQLEVHESAGNVSALQGGGRRRGEPGPLNQSYWSPATRVAAGALGGALMINCLTRRSPFGHLAGIAGFGLMLRAMTNLESKRLLGIRGRRGVDIRKTITIHRPVDEVFDLLSDPANYPQFTDLITAVQDEGDGCYQKTIAGPAGMEVTLHERVTRVTRNEFVAFRSEPDSPLQYAGRAWFVPLDDSTTKVEIQATYNPPGGVIAHGAAWLAGLDPKSLMDDMMMRAKAYLETGDQPRDAASRAEARGEESATPHVPR
jgi:uncharacterized membrane protein